MCVVCVAHFSPERMSPTKSVAVDIEQTSTVYVTLNYTLLNMHPPTPGVPIHFNTEKEEPDVAAKRANQARKNFPTKTSKTTV